MGLKTDKKGKIDTLYDDVSDSELIYAIADNNQDAKDFLYEKYTPLIHKEVDNVYKKNKGLGIEFNDLLQEGMLGFSEAVINYDDYSDVKFITFATLCIRRKLSKYIKKFNTTKNKVRLSEVPLDEERENYNNRLRDVIKDASGKEPLNKLITDESLKEINMTLLSKLSSKEKKAFLYMLDGYDVNDIAKIMEITPKQVYNLIYRARVKIKVN